MNRLVMNVFTLTLLLNLIIAGVSCTKTVYVTLTPSATPTATKTPSATPATTPKGSILSDRVGMANLPVPCYEGRSEQCWKIPIYAKVQNIGGDGVVTVRVDVYYEIPAELIQSLRPGYLQPTGTQFKQTQVYLKQAEEKELEFDFWLPLKWQYGVWCP